MKKKISLLTVFWGDWHTSAFLRYCVPSLLSRYNVPALIEHCTVRMVIATNQENKDALWNSTYFHRLSNLIDIEFACFPDDDLSSLNSADEDGRSATDDTFAGAVKRTNVLVKQQNRVLERGFEDGFGVSYIHPDCVYANPTFDRVGKMANAGCDIIYAPGFRTTYEDFSTSKYGASFHPCENEYDPLARETFEYLHEYHKYQFWDAKVVGHYPSIRFWRESPNLIVAREFHEKIPLYVSNKFRNISIKQGIDCEFDANLYARCVKERGSTRWVSYIDDTRNGFVCSLARRDYDLLRRWALYGALDDLETSKPAPPPPDRRAAYLKGFLIFSEPLRAFSVSHLIRIRLDPSAKLSPFRWLYHAVHFRYYFWLNRIVIGSARALLPRSALAWARRLLALASRVRARARRTIPSA